MLSIETYSKQKDEILTNIELTHLEVVEKLSKLLSDMAVQFSIPLIYSEDYKSKNIHAVSVFESIRDELSRLQMH